MYQKFATMKEAIETLGEVKALGVLNHGHRDQQYRADRNKKIAERNKRLTELEKKLARGEVVDTARRKTA